MKRLPHLDLYRRATALALIAGTGLFLLENLFHPKEFAHGNEQDQLRVIAESAGRWQVAHGLALLSVMLLAAAVLGLAFLVRRRQPVLGLAGGAAGVVGTLGFAAVLAIDGYTWGVLGEVWSRGDVSGRTVEDTLELVQGSGWSAFYYVPTAGFVGGVIALALGLARQEAVPGWAGGLFGLGAFLVGIETVIVSNAYFVFAAAVLFLGGLAVGIEIWRMTPEEFAEGGRPDARKADRA